MIHPADYGAKNSKTERNSNNGAMPNNLPA